MSTPLDPDGREARDLLRDELAKNEYLAARPTWFDTLSAAIRDWIMSLEFGNAQGPPALALLALLVGLVIAIVIALLIFGVPRLNQRSRVAGDLFGEDDDRDAAAIRSAAERAAASGDHTLAITEMFRAIARGLAERTVLTVTPGTTAHDFALRAARVFPDFSDALSAAAATFDGVRYLGRDGSSERYAEIAALEVGLRRARPALERVGA